MPRRIEVEYRAVNANDVSSDAETLTRWLNAQRAAGWTLVAADDGIIYLQRVQR